MYAYILRYLALYILILLCYVAMYRSKCYIFSHFHLILSLVPSVAVATTKAWLDLNQCTLSTYLYYMHPNTRQTQQYNAQDMIIITILVIVLARIIIMIIMCALSFSPCVLLLSCTFINLTWLNSFTYKHRYRHHHQNYCDCYTATHTLTGKLRRICTATHEIPLFVLDYTATFFPFSLIKVSPSCYYYSSSSSFSVSYSVAGPAFVWIFSFIFTRPSLSLLYAHTSPYKYLTHSIMIQDAMHLLLSHDVCLPFACAYITLHTPVCHIKAPSE